MAEAELLGDIIEHMRFMADCESEKNKYFYWDSELWKAIRNAIEHNELIKHPENSRIHYNQGTGADITLKNVHLYAMNYAVKPPEEPTVFAMEIEIEYVAMDEDGYNDKLFTEKHTLQVPVALEVEFNQNKFEAWAYEQRAVRIAKEKEVDLVKLRELMEKYPDEVRGHLQPPLFELHRGRVAKQQHDAGGDSDSMPLRIV